MYVIFPLEDLLDPYSDLSRQRSAAGQQQRLQQNNNKTDKVCPPLPQPNHVIPPNQQLLEPQSPDISSSQPLDSPINTTTGVTRSGSIRTRSQATQEALTSQLSQLKQQPPSQQPIGCSKVSQGNQSNSSNSSIKSVKSQSFQLKVAPIEQQQQVHQKVKSSQVQQNIQQGGGVAEQRQEVGEQLNLAVPQPLTKTQTTTPTKGLSSCAASADVATAGKSQAPIIITRSDSKRQRDNACDTSTSVSSSIQPSDTLSNRNSWPDNQRSSSFKSNVARSSSFRSKERIRPTVLPDSNIVQPETLSSPRRKAAIVECSSLSKELAIKQQINTTASCAKDYSRLSAKEFNHNVSGSDVTIGSTELCSLKSPLGIGNRKGGLVRETSFTGRDLGRSISVRSTTRSGEELDIYSPEDHPTTPTTPIAGAGRFDQASGGVRSKIKTSERLQRSVTETYHSSTRPPSKYLESSSLAPPPRERTRVTTSDPRRRARMATGGGGGGDVGVKTLSHPALNEPLKAHNNVTFKLLKTGE